MRKLVLIALGLAACGSLQAQSFSDDFESYTAGSYLAQSNPLWHTWKNSPGTDEDVLVSNAKAHSGSNSIYFTSSSTSGGPTDILLPFGGQYSTGQFSLEMYMYVDKGKVGYFNLQANTTPGTTWAMDMNLKSDGTFEITNTDAGTLLSGTYTQGQWIDVKMQINLNSSDWELLIDGTSKGHFSNPVLSVASMDLFAMSGSSFYVDDVSYNYTPYTMPALNAAVLGIYNEGANLAGLALKPKVLLRNLGTTAISSCDLALSYNGKNANKHLSGLNLASGDTMTVAMDGSIMLASGSNDATVTISNVNGGTDADNSDNSKSTTFNPVTPAANKLVVAEEATGTWCGWCPRGAVFLATMTDKYGKLFQGIAVHNNDPMTVVTYDGTVSRMVSGFPSVLVDRGTAVDPSVIENQILQRVVVAPHAVLQAGAQYDSSSKTLKVSLNTTFNDNVSGDYRIACVIVEDGVKGTTSKYAQSNYYAGGASGKMGGFEKLPSVVPASKMVYDHVARAIAPNFKGLQNSFPASISSGSKYTHTFTFDMSGYNMNNIHIIGMLIGPDGRTDNATSATVAEASTNGYVTGTEVTAISTLQGPDQMSVYPNPAQNVVYIGNVQGRANVSILDLTGKVVSTQEMNLNGNSQAISVDGLSEGMYLVRVQTVNQLYTSKIMIKR